MSESQLNAQDVHRALMAKRWYHWGFKLIWRWWFVAGSVVAPLPIIQWVWGYNFVGANKIHTALLQIFGVVFFLFGVRGTLKRFNKPGAIERVVAWAKESPIVQQRQVTASGAASLSSISASARGRVFMPADERKSVDE